MKKWLAMLVAAALLCSSALAQSDDDSYAVSETTVGEASAITSDGREMLREAIAMLDDGHLIDAVNALAGISGDAEAAKYAAYARARLSMARNDYADAKERFATLGDFLDAAFQCRLVDSLSQHRYHDGERFGYVDAQGAVTINARFDWAERVFREESRAPYDAGDEAQSLLTVAVVFRGTTAATRYDLLPDKGKYGLLRSDDRMIVPMVWDEVLWTRDGVAALRDTQNEQPRYALFDLLTGARIGGDYQQVGAYSEGYIAVKQNDKWGYISADGTMLAGGFCWDKALDFSEGMAGVMLDKQAGFIDQRGRTVIPLEYQDVAPFGEGLAGFRLKKRWGFLDAQGNVVVKQKYESVGVFNEGCCAVQSNKRWGLIDRDGQVILKLRYSEITDFDPVYHRAWIRTNKLWGLVAPSGTVVLTPAWASYTPFGADGLSCVSYRGSYGYINAQGTAFIPVIYPYATRYSANLGGMIDQNALVQYRNRFGRGFTLPVDVPTEALHGFIEGRAVTETIEEVVDARGKKKNETRYALRFFLFDISGEHITVQ